MEVQETPSLRLLRMTPHDFDDILGLIQDDITKTNTNMRDSIQANIKVALAIPFAATINCVCDVKLFC